MANAFHMFLDLRSNIGEDFTAEEHWTDRRLQSALNAAQTQVALMFSKAPGDWLLTSSSVTPSSSKITLPSDCARPVRLEITSSEYPISFSSTVRERDVAEGYFEDLYITINQDTFTDACTLWYEKRIPDLAFGVVSAGAASSLTMDSGQTPSYVNDYYNGVIVETMGTTNYEIKISSTVSDYTASTRIMTVTGTPTVSDYYGTISLLPVEAHELIVVMATAKVLSKPSSSIDPNDRKNWRDDSNLLRREIEEWLSTRSASTGRIRETGDD